MDLLYKKSSIWKYRNILKKSDGWIVDHPASLMATVNAYNVIIILYIVHIFSRCYARKSTIRAWLNILASYLHRSSWQLCCVDHCIIWDRNLARTSSHCIPKSLNIRYHMIDVLYIKLKWLRTLTQKVIEKFFQIKSYYLKLKIFLISF